MDNIQKESQHPAQIDNDATKASWAYSQLKLVLTRCTLSYVLKQRYIRQGEYLHATQMMDTIAKHPGHYHYLIEYEERASGSSGNGNTSTLFKWRRSQDSGYVLLRSRPRLMIEQTDVENSLQKNRPAIRFISLGGSLQSSAAITRIWITHADFLDTPTFDAR